MSSIREALGKRHATPECGRCERLPCRTAYPCGVNGYRGCSPLEDPRRALSTVVLMRQLAGEAIAFASDQCGAPSAQASWAVVSNVI
jgi:hypothetical protein